MSCHCDILLFEGRMITFALTYDIQDSPSSAKEMVINAQCTTCFESC